MSEMFQERSGSELLPGGNGEQLQKLQKEVEAKQQAQFERLPTSRFLVRKVLLSTGGGLYSAPNRTDPQVQNCPMLLNVLRTPVGAPPEWLHVGTSDGRVLGWVRQEQVEEWNSRQAVAIAPQSEVRGMFGAGMRSLELAHAGREHVIVPVRQLQYHRNPGNSIDALRWGVLVAQVNRPVGTGGLSYNPNYAENSRVALEGFHYPFSLFVQSDSPFRAGLVIGEADVRSFVNALNFLRRDMGIGNRPPTIDRFRSQLQRLATLELSLLAGQDLPRGATVADLRAFGREFSPSTSPVPSPFIPQWLTSSVDERAANLLRSRETFEGFVRTLQTAEDELARILESGPHALIRTDGEQQRHVFVPTTVVP